MKLKIVLKGGKGSGFYGHRGRPGKVGGSTSVSSYEDMADWNPDGISTVFRGGDIPKSGPVYLSSSASTALSYGIRRNFGVYQFDTRKILVVGTGKYDRIMSRALGEDRVLDFEDLAMDLYTDPPQDFLDTLRKAGYVGYASYSGEYVRIEEEGKGILEKIR